MTCDEAPYPEFGTHWERPEGEPCPGCGCCTKRLCEKAATKATVCAFLSDDPDRVADCPCSRPDPEASSA